MEETVQQNLYTFINSRAKVQGMKVDDLARECGFSRSTMYRYMNGVLEIPYDLAECLGEVLRLDEGEKQEFNRLIHLVGEPSVTLAREVLDGFFFHPELREEPVPELPLVCYQNNDRYLRNLDEIVDAVLGNADQEQFDCHVYLRGCINQEIWPALKPALEKLLERQNVQVSQLLHLNEEDAFSSIQAMLHVVPMLRRPNYQVYYAQYREHSQGISVPDQSLFIRASYARGGRRKNLSYFVRFQDKGLSPCLAVREEDSYQFFSHCFADSMDSFPHAMVRGNGNTFTSEFLDIQKAHDGYLIKPTLSHDDIPPSVYQSMLKRIVSGETPADLSGITLAGGAVTGDAYEGVLALLETLAQRYQCSFARRHVGVHSCTRLIDMAETGRISDHLAFVPSFSPEELVEIFTVARDRNADPKDSFTIHLVDGPMYSDGCAFLAYKDHSLVVQYGSDENFSQDMWSYLSFPSGKLADYFADYVDRHVTHSSALSTAEATAFFDRLIAIAKERSGG